MCPSQSLSKGSGYVLLKRANLSRQDEGGRTFDEIVLASINYVSEARRDSIKEFARSNIYIKIGVNSYSAKVIVGFTGNDMVLCDVIDIQPAHFDIKKIPLRRTLKETPLKQRNLCRKLPFP